MLLKEAGDDSIWLPSSLGRRYGLNCVGTLESRELWENLRYHFGCPGQEDSFWERRIAVCPVQEGLDSAGVLEGLWRAWGQEGQCCWTALPSPQGSPQVCRELREAEGILLAVGAGCSGGRQVELVLSYLEQQDCQVTAAILWNADEKLIRRYYWGRRSAVKAERKKG